MFCNVIVTGPFNKFFTYKLKKGQIVKIGSVVTVPFGKASHQVGMVIEILQDLSTSKKYKIKNVEKINSQIILNNKTIKFLKWISEYTLSPLGSVLKLFLINKNILENIDIQNEKRKIISSEIYLNQEQQNAVKSINDNFNSDKKPLVLEGVTGSGKTEVFFAIVEKFIKENAQVLIMVPEISLTPQLEKRFVKRFGFPPDVWHSKISKKKRQKIWHSCYLGKSIIVVGARSSLFLPFKNLRLIIVDEEHDTSYKQDDNVRYHARDLSVVRSQIDKSNIILSSATPSLETLNNVNKKKYKHVFLSKQFSGIDLPSIELIDLTKNKLEKNKWISNKIYNELIVCLKNKEQALLFLNRRGYSPLSLCVECGHRYNCDYCTSWLVMHNEKKRLLCHHCGSIYKIEPRCPKCQKKDTVQLVGPGIERVEEELKNYFPKKSISIMSSDNANTPNKIKKIVNDFENKKIDILVATQIMAKGYHFPNLSFVGVIDADSGLIGGDMRAIERTYNLLQQVSGRAGRTKQKGKVFIQTYFPKQSVIESLKNRDRKKFIEEALRDRKEFNIPPFSFMTALVISGTSKVKTEMYSKSLINFHKLSSNIELLGPIEAPIFLLRGRYRYRLLMKGKSRSYLNNYTKLLLKKCPLPSSLKLVIDVNPYTFM